MVEIRKTDEFNEWLEALRDRNGKARIQMRLDRLASGNPGSHRNLTGGISELKIDTGPGYRVYYTQRGDVLVVLLCGGDKSSQENDIKTAKELATRLNE